MSPAFNEPVVKWIIHLYLDCKPNIYNQLAFFWYFYKPRPFEGTFLCILPPGTPGNCSKWALLLSCDRGENTSDSWPEWNLQKCFWQISLNKLSRNEFNCIFCVFLNENYRASILSRGWGQFEDSQLFHNWARLLIKGRRVLLCNISTK